MTEHFDDADGSEEHPATPSRSFGSRAPRISRADVVEAADALLFEGHKPSIDRIRMRIGRGSPNTIQEYLEIWWTQLGARVKDVPGRNLPDVPERVALALQKLWNEALESAHEALAATVSQRDEILAEREAAHTVREVRLQEQEQLLTTRAAALEDSLTLAREQLPVPNQRAERLEISLQARDAECTRLAEHIGVLDAEARTARESFDAAAATQAAERTQLDTRYAASEARWLQEVDRARQIVKEAAKDHERVNKEQRGRIDELREARNELKRDLQQARMNLRSAAVRATQQQKQLTAALAKPRSTVVRKTKRRVSGATPAA